jgi:hypothetical protein
LTGRNFKNIRKKIDNKFINFCITLMGLFFHEKNIQKLDPKNYRIYEDHIISGLGVEAFLK